MNNRILIGGIITLSPLAVMGEAEKNDRPNIVVILADDLGWGDVGYHGSEIRTPNIDRLCAEGIEMDRFYTAPISSPTRSGMLTGRYPNRWGIREIVVRPWMDYGLDPQEEILPEILAENGYSNRALVGKWHLGALDLKYHPLNNGFTRFYGCLNGAIDYFTHEIEGEMDWHDDFEPCHDEGYSTDLITDEAVRLVHSYSQEKDPFFLYVAFNAPHTPLEAKSEDIEPYLNEEQLDALPKNQKRRVIYSAMVTCMDRGIGRICQALEDEGELENTLILFFSDNGAARGGGGSTGGLRGFKSTEWDGGVRAPAVIYYPKFFGQPRKCEQLTGYVDVVPTLRELIGVKKAPYRPLDGISILPVLTANEEKIDRTFYLGCGAAIDSNGDKILLFGVPRKGINTTNRGLTEDFFTNVFVDPSESTNYLPQAKDKYRKLSSIAKEYDAIVCPFKIPEDDGGKNFKAPREWTIK